jgi:hypothetical protein
MTGFPKHGLPPVRLQVQRCVKAARLQLERLREQREKEAAAEIPPSPRQSHPFSKEKPSDREAVAASGATRVK